MQVYPLGYWAQLNRSMTILKSLFYQLNILIKAAVSGKKLFQDSVVGYYWVQLDLKWYIGFWAEHACTINIFRDWKQCTNSK